MLGFDFYNKNTKSYPTAVWGGGGVGGCYQTPPKTCFTQKYGGFKTRCSDS